MKISSSQIGKMNLPDAHKLDLYQGLIFPWEVMTARHEDTLCYDAEKDVPDLHSVLVRPGLDIPFMQIIKGLKAEKTDPFKPGAHVVEVPEGLPGSSFSYTLLFALDADSAEGILRARVSPRAVREVMKTGFSLGGEAARLVPVGYGTVHGTFMRELEARLQNGDLEEDEVTDLNDYRLHVHPDSVFLDQRFRGLTLGNIAGGAMAQPVVNALHYLDASGKAFGFKVELKVDSYFEIYSEGGESAVGAFNTEFDFLKDIQDESTPESLGLHIASFLRDGGW